MRTLWTALHDGRIIPRERVSDMVAPRSDAYEGWQYGLGFWLMSGTPAAGLRGSDAGVSFTSLHDPETDTTCTVVSNWTDGAWPLARLTNGLFR
jgi:CubicO group peptidase (beta-lactamase class C family)